MTPPADLPAPNPTAFPGPQSAPGPRRKDSGFALLLIALMAALLAMSLYMEVPRIAMQSQRAKEQMLVERGEEYKHAIKIFLRANKNTRWPATLDELESFNGQRFLRHRYKDPMTGKDEWRLIHIQNGVLTDSVTTKKPNDKDQASTPNSFIGELAGLGQTPANAAAGPNSALRRRPGDNGPLPEGQTPPQDPNLPPNQPGQLGPNGQPVQPGQFPGQTGQLPGQPGGAPLPPGLPGVPGQTPNQPPNGQPPYPGAPGYQPNLPGTVPPGVGVPPQPGMQVSPTGAPNAAAAMIGQILTSPRPGGMAGLSSGTGNVIGGGIAGVASTADSEGIMVYGDRTNYKEWEFIYDPTKDKAPPNPNGGAIGTPASQMTSQIGAGSQQPGQPAFGAGTGASASTGFGSSNSFGSSSGFGSSPGGGAAPGAGPGGTTPGANSTAGGASFGSGGGVDIRPGKK